MSEYLFLVPVLPLIGFLINGDATDEQLWAYFNALQRAQREIDVAKEEVYRPHTGYLGDLLAYLLRVVGAIPASYERYRQDFLADLQGVDACLEASYHTLIPQSVDSVVDRG